VGIKLAALPHGHILAGQYVVESVTVGGPAHLNHIDVGDVLIKVDGEEMVGMGLSAVTSKLQVQHAFLVAVIVRLLWCIELCTECRVRLHWLVLGGKHLTHHSTGHRRKQGITQLPAALRRNPVPRGASVGHPGQVIHGDFEAPRVILVLFSDWT
jgi:hypothetical protein